MSAKAITTTTTRLRTLRIRLALVIAREKMATAMRFLPAAARETLKVVVAVFVEELLPRETHLG
jgi:septum formation topological specificity factor MinE